MATLGTPVGMTRCPYFFHPSPPVFGQPHDSSNQSEAQSAKESKLLGKDNLGQRALRVGIYQWTPNSYLQDYSLVAPTPPLLSPGAAKRSWLQGVCVYPDNKCECQGMGRTEKLFLSSLGIYVILPHKTTVCTFILSPETKISYM